MSKILLLGADGQLGQELRRSLPILGQVLPLGRADLDLTQTHCIHDVIAAQHPQLVINAAAYTAVDRAESEPELAHSINAIAPTAMAEATERLGIPLIHISTDYVFDGNHHQPYLETDSTNPLSSYGRSKLAGEEGIRRISDRHVILRTAWVYGTHGKGNFVKTMLRLGAERDELRIVTDQIGAPTWALDLAQAVTTFASQLLVATDGAVPPPLGTYHFTNSGVASWYDFAIAIFEAARSLGVPLTVERIIPILTADYPTPARRPSYSVLSLTKTTAVLGEAPRHWHQSLRKMLSELYSYTYESSNSLRR